MTGHRGGSGLLACDAAESRWPGTSRGQLVVRLALEGHRAAEASRNEQRRRRIEALNQHSGAITRVYPRDEVQQLHGERPE